MRAISPLNAKELITHLYFYLGSNGTISNLKNKAHYPLKSGLILKDPKNMLLIEHRNLLLLDLEKHKLAEKQVAKFTNYLNSQ